MDQNTNYIQWVLAIAAIGVGLVGGYFYGNTVGVKKGVEQGVTQGIGQGVAQEKAAEASRKKEAEKAAAKAVNVFDQTKVNPLKAPNPFDAKLNPFK